MASSSSPVLSLLSLLSLLSFFLLLPPSAASVSPSNNSAQLTWTDHLRFSLLPSNFTLVPLTRFLVNQAPRDLATFNITGNLVPVDASNSLSVGNPDIAVISCDDSAYPGRLDADQTVSNVVSADRTPYAVILYSTSAAYCNYNIDGPVPFRAIFSLLNPLAARNITSQISHGDSHPASIIPMSFVTAPPANSPGGDSGDDPNAAVAMIILYSITGIITVLFLGIIITGAVRAHRHPERYGPRYTPGRPRQSRARGVARAMVETIPIVKFGDSNDGKDVKNDVELAMDPESEHAPESRQTENRESRDEGNDLNSEASEQKPEQEGKGQEGNFACPICTDDFIKGQDLRVLPCNHSFHPDCIDPWLVNVSGTCPLCRIDLNPEQENEEEGQEQEGQPGEPSEQADESRQHRGIATYLHNTLNERRMRDASVEERIAALRRVREANREGNEGNGEGRGTLTARVRDRFRIRTRAHA